MDTLENVFCAGSFSLMATYLFCTLGTQRLRFVAYSPFVSSLSGKKLDHRRRASTSPHTVFAPAANKGAAQASKVAPVVQTSSMSRILRL